MLAAAADKTGTFTLDKVIYINSIYGINQLGDLVDEKGTTYFNFDNPNDGSPYVQNQNDTYTGRTSGETCVPGEVWVLQPVGESTTLFEAQCVNILTTVQFTEFSESYDTLELSYDFDDNVRGFAKSADDALQVLEFIHNYKVPEDLYAE